MLKALQTDVIDNCLLHSVGNGGFETFKKRYAENGAAALGRGARRRLVVAFAILSPNVAVRALARERKG